MERELTAVGSRAVAVPPPLAPAVLDQQAAVARVVSARPHLVPVRQHHLSVSELAALAQVVAVRARPATAVKLAKEVAEDW